MGDSLLIEGLKYAFDDWTLTDHLASRMTTLSSILVANFVAKAKAAVAVVANAFTVRAFAPASLTV